LYFDAQHNIGLCNYERKSYAEAIERFKAILAIKENDEESLYNLALSYIRKGDGTEASKIIKRLESLNKEFANKLKDEYKLT
jgi:Tfp pilus assembly protein PilF